jgi:porin
MAMVDHPPRSLRPRRIGPGFLAALAAGALVAGPGQARADWWNQSTMTGDWGGLRTRLADDGLTIKGQYTGEAAGNPTGGKGQGVRYAQEVMLGVDADFQKLLGIPGASGKLVLTDRAGRSLSNDKVGNIMSVQEIYGSGETVRLTELSYDQALFGDRIDIAGGRLITENDFADSPQYWDTQLYCDFQSNAICGTPIAAPINSGYVAYPISSWGGRVKFTPVKDTYVQAGAYEVNPTLANEGDAFKLDGTGDTGAFLPLEVGYKFGDHPGGLQGNIRLGGYYDTSSVADARSQITKYDAGVPATDIPAEQRDGRYGLWLLGDYQVERDTDNDKRGIAVFGAYQYGDSRTALISNYAELGAVRQGTFPGRDQDSIALGVADAEINGRIADLEGMLQADGIAASRQTRETIAEANYGAQVTPWLLVRTGLQYVFHPAGEAEIPNALVLDLKTSITF